MTKSPQYSERSISSLSILARKLNIEERYLISVANTVEKYWKPGRTIIKEGKPPRKTNDARGPLKAIHKQIKQRILDRVAFPYYIQGGIASDENTHRSYHSNAQAHVYRSLLINEDISGFYPSTTTSNINDVWLCFFKFHPDVADVLTKLTTYNGVLPQGWITSTHLANLVLWRSEPKTVARLESAGFTYSRWIDDVTVSSSDFVKPEHKTQVVSEIYRMMQRSGYKPKRTKHDLATAGQKMQVMNLNVDKHYASIPKKERKFTRSAVHRCTLYSPTARNSQEYINLWDKASGRVATLRSLHPAEAQKLRNQLNAVRPQRQKMKSKKRKRYVHKLPAYES